MPQEKAVTACQGQIDTKTERFNLLTNAKSARELERIKARQEEREQKFAEFVFSREEMNRLDFAIQGIAEKNALADFSARPVGTTTALGATKLKHVAQRELVLSFTSDFPNILRFVNDLERHQPAVFVKQFTIRGAAGKTTGLACDMECSVLYPSTGG
jgi:hypothetical protein